MIQIISRCRNFILYLFTKDNILKLLLKTTRKVPGSSPKIQSPFLNPKLRFNDNLLSFFMIQIITRYIQFFMHINTNDNILKLLLKSTREVPGSIPNTQSPFLHFKLRF